jgi:hypothetical protein
MPFQVYAECTIHMFVVDVCMERPYNEDDQLLPTEWVNDEDGMVWDTRRLIQEADWFFTRKSGKTELGAAEDFTEVCFLGDVNSQCLICTNSAEQSQIAFKAIKELAEASNEKNLVSPFLVMGGTDAYNYEPVCENIYRFAPFVADTKLLLCTHGTNERLPIACAEDAIAFFKRYTRRMTQD